MAALNIGWDEATATVSVGGPLTVMHADTALAAFARLPLKKRHPTQIDLSAVTALDTVGALLVLQWAGAHASIRYGNDAQRDTISMVEQLPREVPEHPQPCGGFGARVVALGKWGSFFAGEAKELLTFTGKAAVLSGRALRQPTRLRVPEIVGFIEQVGLRAMPIIGLIAFLIAVVLAYQSAAQLKPYGGEQFTVDLVAISIFREMGVLLTAIMVAGRSGSAFTAEIGVMKSREEVDALQVMGFDPFDMLVLPRLIAIVIALPLLTFFANMMGLAGGFLITHSLVGISFEHFLERVHNAVDGGDLLVGMLKAPVFAFFIGIVGCMHGLRVSGSSESIGRETTASVVKSIFLVLVLDAFFSIFFQEVGL